MEIGQGNNEWCKQNVQKKTREITIWANINYFIDWIERNAYESNELCAYFIPFPSIKFEMIFVFVRYFLLFICQYGWTSGQKCVRLNRIELAIFNCIDGFEWDACCLCFVRLVRAFCVLLTKNKKKQQQQPNLTDTEKNCTHFLALCYSMSALLFLL